MFRRFLRTRAFSLVELVVVIVILGIIAAIAIPRLSRGASGADVASLQMNLAIIRNALNLYATEHDGQYPPGPTAADVAAQLTQYTDASGATSATKDATHKFGPYLLAVPPCPVGENAGSATILVDTTNSPPKVVITGGEGWVYNPGTGEWIANSDQVDPDSGKKYSAF